MHFYRLRLYLLRPFSPFIRLFYRVPSYLWLILLGSIVLCALIATPGVLQIRRSLPCEGEVTEVSDSQREQRDTDGQMVTIYESYHHIRFKNPRTGAIDRSGLQDIYKDKGEKVRLLYDPSDKSIELDSVYRIFKTPIWIFGTLFLMWILIAIIIVKNS